MVLLVFVLGEMHILVTSKAMHETVVMLDNAGYFYEIESNSEATN